MSDNIWVSVRHTDGRTFTVGGANFDEFFGNLTDTVGPQLAPRIVEDFAILADPPVSAQPSPPAAHSAPAGSPPPPGGPSCEHGPRVLKPAFTSKAGRQMPSSWQCQSRDRASQCKAVWNDN